MTEYREASFAYDQYRDGCRYGSDFATIIISNFPDGMHDGDASGLLRLIDTSLSAVTGNLSAPFRQPYADGFNSGLVKKFTEHGKNFPALTSRHYNVG